MIKEFIHRDIVLSKEAISNSLLSDGSGKILKVHIQFEKHETQSSQINLRIHTLEGEEIMNVFNDRDSDVYYPRMVVSGERDETRANITEPGAQTDYYYFTGLIITIEKDNENFEGIAIKKLVIIYDDMNG